MLRRFVAAAAVASVAVAVAAIVVLAVPAFPIQRFSPALLAWCVAPCVWGLWLMIAPSAVVPRNIPAWGTLLGAIAGIMAALVLNMPARVLGLEFPMLVRGVAVVVMIAFYFVMWMIVRTAYEKLAPPAS